MTDSDRLLRTLAALADGRLSPREEPANSAPVDAPDVSAFATVDHDREARCGFPEVVFAERKTPAETAEIAARIFLRSGRVLVTRATPEHADAVRMKIPG